LEHFGRSQTEGGVDEVTQDCFVEAMSGELEAVGFRTEAGFDGLEEEGVLWGGNLSMVCSLLGTPHFPLIKGGILFLEDVNEHPYRVERMLLQLHQAGVLAEQSAVLLGDFSGWRKSPLDRGYNLKSAVEHLRSVCDTPILTGLPFGHVQTLVTLPVGEQVELFANGRNVMVAWG
ncbi:MAG: LD-carboxypeptidase, partial [Leptothrix ochracea]